MANLKYKTRGMSNPQGKPRVYFCCHENDFTQYFETVSNEILKKQNCAIWYNDDIKNETDEQFYEDLKQVQLFVVPVTSKFLSKDSKALNKDYQFAVDNHIPVLPLMQESGLEEVFNQKCGELQFLDKNENDLTAISYEEKLDKYLSSVLVGDEMAEKIRAEFDAYIFMSYRKKDRKYAQELMRLIHNNHYCRDIAIWYDEFLTPGENFNKSIKEALEKSELFVMTVTPNLVNELNYIMDIEYPMAKKAGKQIFPVELVPTDRKELAEKYEGIPACTDAQDQRIFSEAFMEAAKKFVNQKNDDSPEHNFLIGLAYLDGIDVEVNQERALEMITASAESGLIGAIDQLITMYEHGKGVSHSNENAILWMERKILYFEEKYKENPDKTIMDDLFWAYMMCGLKYRRIGEFEKARQKYLAARQLCEDLENPSVSMRRNTYIAEGAMGDVFREEWKFQEALEKYKLQIAGAKLMWEEVGEWKYCADLVDTYTHVGMIYSGLSDYEKALENYEAAYTVLEKTEEGRENIGYRRRLSSCHTNIGVTYIDIGNQNMALEHYEKSYEILKEIVEETGSIDAREGLAIICLNIGRVHYLKEDINKAIEYYEKSLLILQKLTEETGELRVYLTMSQVYSYIGSVYLHNKKYEKALEKYQQEIEITEGWIKKIGEIASLQERLAIGYSQVGGVYRSMKNNSLALQYHEKAEMLYNSLLKENGLKTFSCQLCQLKTSIGVIFCEMKDFNKAREYFEECLKLLDNLDEDIRDIRKDRQAALVYWELGNVFNKEEKDEEAKIFYKKSMKIQEILYNKTGLPGDAEKLARCYERVGIIYEKKENLKKALEYYEKFLEIQQWIVDNQGILDMRYGLAEYYHYVGNLFLEEKNTEKAMEICKKGVPLIEQLRKEDSQEKTLELLVKMYYLILDIYCEEAESDKLSGNLEKAIDNYENCLIVIKEIEAKKKSPEIWPTQAKVLKKLGILYRELSMLEKALEYFEQSIELLEKYSEHEETIELYSYLSSAYNYVGNICYQQKVKFEKYFKYQCKRLLVEEVLFEKTGAEEHYDALCEMCSKVVYLYNDHKNDIETARKIAQRYLLFAKNNAKDPDSKKTLFYVADAYYSIAKTHSKWEKRRYLKKALKKINKCCKSYPEEKAVQRFRERIKKELS